MFFPALIFFMLNKNYTASIKLGAFLFLAVFSIALIFSYTRAAWLSLVLALVAYFLLMLRVKFRSILITFSIIASIIFIKQIEIIMKLIK